MSQPSAATPEFIAPGPGSWELDRTHFPRAMTRYVTDVICGPFERTPGRVEPLGSFATGFSEGTAKFGILLDHIEVQCVNGFVYNAPRPVAAPKGAKGPPPKLVFKLLLKLHPAMRARVKSAKKALEARSWLDDMRHWDDEYKPRVIREYRAAQDVDLSSMDDAALARHMGEARHLAQRGIYGHHRFTATACLPIGDFLAHAMEWTGTPAPELLQLLRGYSPVSSGMAAPELDKVVAAIRAAGVQDLLTGTDSSAVLQALRESGDDVRGALQAWLDMVGFRVITGYDICDLSGHEMPDMLVRTLRVANEAADSPGKAEEVETRRAEATAAARDKVPDAHRPLFDQLLDDARTIYRLRDERGIYNDSWTTGLARRAVLEAGKRLAENGRLDHAELALDATAAELAAMLDGTGGPTSDELAAHQHYRKNAKIEEAPDYLGHPPSDPPPDSWMPPHAGRVARAMGVFLGNLFGDSKKESSATVVKGIAVSPGTYEGPARMVRGPEDFSRIEKGDVLLTASTSPYFNPVLPLLGGIITDRGGALSHAAIVAREYGIPGVVGTKKATSTIADGATVRIDGSAGEITVLS